MLACLQIGLKVSNPFVPRLEWLCVFCRLRRPVKQHAVVNRTSWLLHLEEIEEPEPERGKEKAKEKKEEEEEEKEEETRQ